MSRPRRAPTDDWAQLRLLLTDSVQETYELLRPILLFGQPAAERVRETGTPARTLQRKAARFDAAGMRSLFDSPAPAAEDRRPPKTAAPRGRRSQVGCPVVRAGRRDPAIPRPMPFL